MSVKTKFAVEAHHLSLAYGPNTILENVSFAIPEGTYVGIVGPNGGGKTTLLRMIMGLLKPDTGSIAVFGKSPLESRKGGSIGYVPQKITQMDYSFPATVKEIVRSGRTPKVGIGRWLASADHQAVESALELTKITHLQERLIGTLSGGERQKVFIARSLAAESKLLILDEPTTGVDVSAQEQFYILLKKLNRDLGITILFVSHDIEMMTKEVSFILALNQKLLCHCSSHEFLSDKTLRKLYGREVELLHHHTH
jgi:zinc transport system ATP-binding protein